jgi:Cu(I)-responsive transcriptional regulator
VTIGQVALKAKVRAATIRYYERRGLMPHPIRRASGYREYSPDSVRTVRFIKQAQTLGFTLDEIAKLLRLAAGMPRSCSSVRSLATLRIDEMDRKIAMLQAMRESLRRLVRTCRRPQGRRDCPLLDALEEAAK